MLINEPPSSSLSWKKKDKSDRSSSKYFAASVPWPNEKQQIFLTTTVLLKKLEEWRLTDMLFSTVKVIYRLNLYVPPDQQLQKLLFSPYIRAVHSTAAYAELRLTTSQPLYRKSYSDLFFGNWFQLTFWLAHYFQSSGAYPITGVFIKFTTASCSYVCITLLCKISLSISTSLEQGWRTSPPGTARAPFSVNRFSHYQQYAYLQCTLQYFNESNE